MTTLLSSIYTVLDTETTGLQKDDRAVSFALIRVTQRKIVDTMYHLVHPQRRIPSEVTAIHGITDEDVAQSPFLETLLPTIQQHVVESIAYVAHNAPFDRRMLPGLQEKPWIDTLVLARVVYPNLSSYRNEALREYLQLDCSELTGCAHNALYDAQVTAKLFLHLLPLFLQQRPEITTITQLVTALEQERTKPRLLATCFLPKHKGSCWEDIPSDYLQWIVAKYSGDPSVVYTARHHLQSRKAS